MNVEKFAKMLHESGREPVEKGKVLNPMKCTNIYGGNRSICLGGELHLIVRIYMNGHVKTKATGEKCPRCNGTGLEPFIDWNSLTTNVQEGRAMQAQFIDNKVIVVDNEILRAAIMSCHDRIREEVLAEAFSRVDDDDARDGEIAAAVAGLDRFKRMEMT
jgi:hypothetical protein